MKKIETAVLLVNLGSPKTQEKHDIKAYLKEFLSDPYVIRIPALFRALLINWFILPLRINKSVKKYSMIWTKYGSPMLIVSKLLTKKLNSRLSCPVYLAMRYQEPGLEQTLKKIAFKHPDLKKLIIIPLYPHFALSTTQSTLSYIRKISAKLQISFKLDFVEHFYNHPLYIEALYKVARPYLQNSYDHLLFSYHSLPLSHIRQADPGKNHCLKQDDCCEKESPAISTCYRAQILTTTRLFLQKAGISKNKASISYQSQFGKKWLEPFTDEHIFTLLRKDIKSLLVICPSFVADCVETLEEINIGIRQNFLYHGGISLTTIPCLNDDDAFVYLLEQLVKERQTKKGIASAILSTTENGMGRSK